MNNSKILNIKIICEILHYHINILHLPFLALFHILFFCKTFHPNGAKLGSDDPWEEELLICRNEVDSLLGGAIVWPKRGN